MDRSTIRYGFLLTYLMTVSSGQKSINASSTTRKHSDSLAASASFRISFLFRSLPVGLFGLQRNARSHPIIELIKASGLISKLSSDLSFRVFTSDFRALLHAFS